MSEQPLLQRSVTGKTIFEHLNDLSQEMKDDCILPPGWLWEQAGMDAVRLALDDARQGETCARCETFPCRCIVLWDNLPEVEREKWRGRRDSGGEIPTA